MVNIVNDITRYADGKNWESIIGGFSMPNFIIAIGVICVICLELTWYDEIIMANHILYKHFGRMVKANIVDMGESVININTGRQFYSVIWIPLNGKNYETKIIQEADDELGKQIDVIIYGKRKPCAIRANVKKPFFKIVESNWRKEARVITYRGLLNMFILAGALGFQYILRGIILICFFLLTGYLLYPLRLKLRGLIWKINLTRGF